MDIETGNELRRAKSLVMSGQHLPAMDLLRGILVDEPHHREARRLLRATEKAFKGSNMAAGLVKLGRITRLSKLLPEAVKEPIRKLISVS
jgi:hypothetical protein